ncbi:MAG: KilA-N domain-containing protein [Bacteroidales bacterium]|jgi:hypothetical protein|nr:KilA-N domain-containing protein [Bacteroidales bacterium]
MAKITVKGTEITIISVENEEYFCITDMLKVKDGDFFVTDWLRNRNTLEYIGIWEQVYNPHFNYGEFAIIKNKAGLNNFKISVKEFVEKTNAISLQAKAGRYGGTYAHKDIAFEFAMWISPEFKIYIIKEFQRLKEAETNPMLGEWNVKRVLSKVNYTLHTDAVRDFVIPKIDVEREKTYAYADEADMLNLALWSCTAKQWREANPEHAKKNLNIRDTASINELVVLANLESFNAELLKRKIDKAARYACLHEMAQRQLTRLDAIDAEKGFRKLERGGKRVSGRSSEYCKQANKDATR